MSRERPETVSEALAAWFWMRERTREVGKSTIVDLRCRTRSLEALAGHRAPGDVDSAMVDDWLESIGHLAQASRRHYFTTTRQFFDWCVAEGLAERNPLRGRKAPKEPRRLPRALHAPAVAAILEHCEDQRTRVIIILMVQLGLRRGEVAGLEVEDFDLYAGEVRVTGKGGHERLLPVPRQAMDAIEAYLDETGARSGPLLRSSADPTKGLRPQTVSYLVKDVMLAAGVKRRGGDRVTAHALRHTMATDLIRNGAHLLDVQQALGHSSLTATQNYLPLVVDGLAETMAGRWYGNEPDPEPD